MMKGRAGLIVGALAALGSLCAIAASASLTKRLTGVYAITTTNVDPGPKDPRDSHFIVYLDGESAQSLYGAMKVRATTNDACLGPERQVKKIGGTTCSFSPVDKAYSCSLAINIASQKIEGMAC